MGAESESFLAQAKKFQASGLLDKAIEYYQQSLAIEPETGLAQLGLGQCFYLQHNYSSAQFAFKQALKVLPEHAEVYHGLALIARSHGKITESIALCKSALELNPELASIHNTIALLYQSEGHVALAIEHYQLALSYAPENAESWSNLGNVYLEQHLLFDALNCFQQSIRFAPHLYMTYANLARLFHYTGDIVKTIEWLERGLNILKFLPKEKVNFRQALLVHSQAIYYSYSNPYFNEKQLFEAISNYAQIFGDIQPLTLTKRSLEVERVLRVGYLSSDFRQHSAVGVFEQIFAHHDPRSIEIFAYANLSEEDHVTQRLKALVPHWRKIKHLNDREVFQLIQQDKIDVLVDLNGHTGGNRLSLFMLKPAPIQVTGPGFGHTTALQSMDYLLIDPNNLPPKNSPFSSEKLFYLKSWIQWLPPDFEWDEKESPWERNEYITLGCGNSLFKLNPVVIEAWNTILKQLPAAKLHIKAPPLNDIKIRERLQHAFGEQAERLIFSGQSDQRNHMMFYQDIDLVLDPFPFGGGISSCESLWMRVPMVSMSGTGSSLLSQVGLQSLVCHSIPGYIDTVVALAQRPEKLLNMRKKIKQQLLNSTICKPELFAASLEQAYRMMWRIYCREQLEAV